MESRDMENENRLYKSKYYTVSMLKVIAEMEHPKEYNIAWFKKKFSAIDEKYFGRGEFRGIDKNMVPRFCLFGFCGCHYFVDAPLYTEEGNALAKLFGNSSTYPINDKSFVMNINDLLSDSECEDDIFVKDAIESLGINDRDNFLSNVVNYSESIKERILYALNILEERQDERKNNG